MRGWVSLAILAVLASMAAAACAPKAPPRARSVPRPAVERVSVDYSLLFDGPRWSNTVYAEPREPDLMKRVAIGPNLVFAASRSSLSEPYTTGPTAGPISDPVGDPVAVAFSTVLLRYLNERGSQIFAPAAFRRWCSTADCASHTFVERLLLSRQGATSDANLPTVALAVRRLGISWKTIDVVAEETEKRLVLRPRRNQQELTACPALRRLEVPTIALSVELVSARDGRLLARIDEYMPPQVEEGVVRDVVSLSWEPRRMRGRSPQGSYQYVARWTPKDVACDNAGREWADLATHLLDEVQLDLENAFSIRLLELLQASMDVLYESR
jgi:hypothetical protein